MVYAANIGQVYKTNPAGVVFDGWVIFLRLGSNTERENAIRSQHEAIETELAESNVSYTEVTTRRGRDDIYKLFACRNRKHPLFLILVKHPSSYGQGAPFLLVEWGRWTSAGTLADDLFRLLPLVSADELLGLATDSASIDKEHALVTFIERENFEEMKAGLTISLQSLRSSV